jgi:PAS domain S-box-containing protein
MDIQDETKEQLITKLNEILSVQNEEKEKRAAELIIANKELLFQNEEKEKRAAELIIANKELLFQNEEKEKRSAELIIANKELAFQNEEKEKRAAELAIANKELAFQNEEKENRATELVEINEKLRESEVSLIKSNETFLKLFDHNPTSMGIRRISDSVMVNVNATFLELFGFANKEEVIGKTTIELKLFSDQEKYRVDNIINQTDEAIRDFEVQLQNKQGGPIWISASLMKLEIDNEPCLLSVSVDITQRKKVEEELKKGNVALTVSNAALRESELSLVKSNDTFSKLFDNNPCGISICSKEGRKYINVNDAFLKLYGFSTKEEVIGKTGVELGLLAKTDSNTVDEIALKNTFSNDFEVIIQAKNGKKLCISTSLLNIEIDNSPCVVVVSIDITERKKAEDKLKKMNALLIFENEEKEDRAAELITANNELLFQSEEKIKRAAELIVAKEKAELYLDMAGSAFVSLDQNGNILLVNQKCLDLLKYDTSEELKGKNWFDTCIPPETNELFKQAYSEVMKGEMESSEYYENEVVTKSGNRRVIYWNNSLIKDKNGQIIELFCSGIDITERKHSEQALIKIKDEFLLLAESMPQIVWITLPDGMNIYFNQQWVDYTGLTLEESYGNGWIKPFHPDDQKSAWNAWQNAVTKNAKYSLECRLRRKDGEYFWWLVRGVPVLDKKGNIIKWFGTCTDIHNFKETEIELFKAKEKAEEADRLKSAFLANMSHEIRTPMNGILGFADLLKEPRLTREIQQEYISIIEKSGVRMLNIINDIIDISKIEAGLMEINIQEVNINKQIEFIHTFFKPQVEEKELLFSIKNTLSDKESFIKSDSEKIYSILTNLVKNAIKFTEQGTIELGYTLKTENDSTELEFYVKDMGIGIPKDLKKSVFERFIQADVSNKMASQGTGLGLSISKAYVEMLGGKMWIESEEGKGSIFYFTLPYHAEIEEKTDPDKDSWSEKLSCEVNSSTMGLKILAAEDDKISRMLILAILKGNTKELLEAVSGIEAVDICRNNPDIDLILMDMQMPGLNGYEATQQIRQFNKDVIIIAQSAFGLSEDREKAIIAGCNDYISKPINKTELLALIHKYFNKECIDCQLKNRNQITYL